METYKSVFKQEIQRKYYYFVENSLYHWFDSEIGLYYTHKHVGYKTIHECTIEKPPFEENENVYVPELDKEYKIVKKVRSTNGEMVYYVSEWDVIEDDITKESIAIGFKQKEEYYKAEETKSVKETKKKWYEFWR